jgi:membrane protease YdiL (CAAX protease family)
LAILGSAAVFALVHPPISVIPVFGLGIAAAISFQKSGFLLAPIFTHAVYNTVVIFLNKL